jgi:hypothetical protein
VKLAGLRRQVEALGKKYRRRPPTLLDVLLGAAKPADLAPADRALFDRLCPEGVSSLYQRDNQPDPLEEQIREARLLPAPCRQLP